MLSVQDAFIECDFHWRLVHSFQCALLCLVVLSDLLGLAPRSLDYLPSSNLNS